MVAGIQLAILAMIFWFLKYLFDRFILKKSKDEIALKNLRKRSAELYLNPSMLKSQKKIDKELEDIDEEINILENKIKNN